MILPVAILAGGLARRLGPIAEKIPKALVDVAGEPFVVRQLEYLKRQGITRVVLCVGHLGEEIEAIIGDGSAFGIDVYYSWDGHRLLGTGGALRQALPRLGEKFLVLYGDSYLPIDFPAVVQDFLASGKPALMTILKNGNRWDKSNVLFCDGHIVEFNKRAPTADMTYIDYGLGALHASVFANSPVADPFDLADLYHELSLRGLLAGKQVFERFYEVGSPEGLKETSEYFKKRDES